MSLSKKKLLIIFPQQLFVRNFFSAINFSELSENYDVSVALNEQKNAHSAEYLKDIPHIFYKYENSTVKQHMDFMDVMVWTHRKKSSSFLYRSKRMLHIYGYHYELLLSPLKYLHTLYKKGQKTILKFASHILKDMLLFFKRLFLYNRPFGDYVQFLLIQKIPINSELSGIVDLVNPDLIIMPSGGFEPEGLDLVRICQKRGTKTLFLVDNWDNLSSKTIFYARPDYITVIGPQSYEHALRIQKFKPEQVFVIGTPRFDIYDPKKEFKSPFDFEYILFVGTFLNFDDRPALELIDRLISEDDLLRNKVKIVYRPHPAAKNTSLSFLDLENVIIDPQVASLIAENTNAIFPPLEYYPGLIQNSLVVVGGLTTMLIEALIMHKNYITLCYDDAKNFTHPKNALKYYEHFNGLEGLSGLRFIHDLVQLKDALYGVILKENPTDWQLSDLEVDYYCHLAPDGYKKAFYHTLQSVFEEKN